MTVATKDDVAKALGRPITVQAEIDQVNYWLDAAELIIVARLGPAANLDQPTLKYVETEAVVTRMSNPEGYQSESIDDYTYRFGSETRRVTILDEWWNMLDPDAGSGAFTIRPGAVPTSADWAECP